MGQNPAAAPPADFADVKAFAGRLLDAVEQVIVGKRDALELILVALLAEGHVLIEDVPGVGKTTLVRTLARALASDFRRIQFSPDLLPSDITGVNVFDARTGRFEFHPGPIFAQIVLADEINRTPPKTQSSLLECMEERQVTVDGNTRPLPRPFLVLATQNPIEYEGTFPLAEAQIDRFMLTLRLGYPNRRQEREILTRLAGEHPLHTVMPVARAEEVVAMQARVREVFVHDDVKDYAVRLVERTRDHPALRLGASPRASLALFRGARAMAALRGRSYVLPDDVQALAVPVLAHRLILHPEADLDGQTAGALVRQIAAEVPVPALRPGR